MLFFKILLKSQIKGPYARQKYTVVIKNSKEEMNARNSADFFFIFCF